MNKTDYLRLLNNPPKECRPATRWWWFGPAVTEEEIKRELKLMREAGLGGVEIQVVYPIQEGGNAAFFSPEFFQKLNYALKTCEKLGLQADLTLGSGWPFGGPFIGKEMAPQVLIPYQIEREGTASFSRDFSGELAGEVIGAAMGKLRGERLIEESLRDIGDKLKETRIHGWPYGYRIEDLQIPEGRWLITLFVSSRYRQQVGKAAIGMSGFALDHCRKDVLERYLHSFAGPLLEKVGAEHIDDLFCDSIELAGNNWTSTLLEEFETRRGYDLRPYLPLLWTEGERLTEAVRYDYHKTMAELTEENFFHGLANWCDKHDVNSRIQAHGTWGDILASYGAADVPEGETFGAGDKLEVNTVHRRLASSAGAVYGKEVVSNESFTWLRTPRFLVDLEAMKLATDAIFLDGMNRIVNHGYPYSPPEAGEPGWSFYASSFICEKNTWWKYYPKLARYTRRVSGFLRRGRLQAEVGVYLPQHDVWAEKPLSELHMSRELEERMDKELIESLSRGGYWFNYLNDEAICKLGEMEKGGLSLNGNLYRLILLPHATRMPPETARKLSLFLKKGGILVWVGEGLKEAPGMVGRKEEENHERLREEILPSTKNRWQNWGEGKTLLFQGKAAELSDKLNQVLRPELAIGGGQGAVGYVHRKRAGEDIYFLANVSRKRRQVWLRFREGEDNFLLLDPLEKAEKAPLQRKEEGEGIALKLELAPCESNLVIFEEDLPPPGIAKRKGKKRLLKDISSEWLLRVEELQFSKKMGRLTTWENFSRTRHYCGAAFYEKKFELQSEDLQEGATFLKLEELHEVGEVFLNGEKAGVIWKHPYQLQIDDYLRAGQNSLRIKVTNLWINHFLRPETDLAAKGPESAPVLTDPPYFGQVIEDNRAKRLSPWREREMMKKPQPSGLRGKVQLLARKTP